MEVKGQIYRPCAFIGIGNSEQEMQQLSLEDKVEGGREGGMERGMEGGREERRKGGREGVSE